MFERVRERLRRLPRYQAITATALVGFKIVNVLSNIEFMGQTWERVAPSAQQLWEWLVPAVGENGWLVGVAWLTWLLIRSEPRSAIALPRPPMTESAPSAAPPIWTGITGPPVTPVAPDPPVRTPLMLSPSELTRLYRQGGTQIQSDALVAQHMGRWRTVSVVIERVERVVNFVLQVSGKDAEGTLLNLWFKLDLADRLSGFMPGDKITATGRVNLVSGGQVIFNDCELSE